MALANNGQGPSLVLLDSSAIVIFPNPSIYEAIFHRLEKYFQLLTSLAIVSNIPRQGQDLLESTSSVPDGNPLFSVTLDSSHCIKSPDNERGQRLASVKKR